MPRNRGKNPLDQRATKQVDNLAPGIEYLRLNRQQICHTEINAAIRLFIIDEDPIPAHLLASAANEIMTALSAGKSGVGLNDVRELLKSAPSELSDEVFQSLMHPYNFLKHGSSDIEVRNDFPVEFIIMTIYTAVESYKRMFGKLSPEMSIFYGMVIAWRIQWWEGSPGQEERRKIAERFPLNGASRAEFCRFGRDMIRQARARAG